MFIGARSIPGPGLSLRVTEIDGAPWFVAADVCAALGIINARDTLAKSVPEKHKRRKDLGLRAQAPWLVTEAGLYRLVMRSNKPEASDFQDWVTDTVLPAIRKDGSYVKDEEKVATGEMSVEEMTLRVIGALQAKVAALTEQAQGMDPNEARVMTVPAFREAYGIDGLLASSVRSP